MNCIIEVATRSQGLHEITREIQNILSESGAQDGLLTVLVRHTSASLIIQENADPSARRDLEAWLNRLVAPNDPLYTHTLEGADDMPSHIKSALTSPMLSIPFMGGRLTLGTWQGIYLWEHRARSHRRSLAIHVGE